MRSLDRGLAAGHIFRLICMSAVVANAKDGAQIKKKHRRTVDLSIFSCNFISSPPNQHRQWHGLDVAPNACALRNALHRLHFPNSKNRTSHKHFGKIVLQFASELSIRFRSATEIIHWFKYASVRAKSFSSRVFEKIANVRPRADTMALSLDRRGCITNPFASNPLLLSRFGTKTLRR